MRTGEMCARTCRPSAIVSGLGKRARVPCSRLAATSAASPCTCTFIVETEDLVAAQHGAMYALPYLHTYGVPPITARTTCYTSSQTSTPNTNTITIEWPVNCQRMYE